MADSYLQKTFTSNGNRRTMTISFWVKRASEGTQTTMMGTGSTGAINSFIRFEAAGRLKIFDYNGQSDQWIVETSRYLRDCTSWYHLHFIIDSTQSTAADRVQVWINGERVTKFNSPTYPDEDSEGNWNTAAQSWAIGCQRYSGSNSQFFDGQIAHMNFIDGTACAATVFGETDSTTGEWKPILSPSVTYGDEGFFLKFENSGALGTDSSGNSNTFTVNGSLKQSISTPSNNFTTFDGNQTHSAVPIMGGTGLSAAPGAWCTMATNYAMLKGKWYVEGKYVSGTYSGVGFFRYGGNYSADVPNKNDYPGNFPEGYFYKINQKVLATNAVETTYSGWASISAGDIAMMALDLDNGKAWYGINGTWHDTGSGTGVPNTGAYPHHTFTTGTGNFWGVAAGGYDATTMHFNFGEGRFGTTALSSANDDNNSNGTFEYAPPAGFYSICTKNIKEYG